MTNSVHYLSAKACNLWAAPHTMKQSPLLVVAFNACVGNIGVEMMQLDRSNVPFILYSIEFVFADCDFTGEQASDHSSSDTFSSKSIYVGVIFDIF